jgi:hypothetical protein
MAGLQWPPRGGLQLPAEPIILVQAVANGRDQGVLAFLLLCPVHRDGRFAGHVGSVDDGRSRGCVGGAKVRQRGVGASCDGEVHRSFVPVDHAWRSQAPGSMGGAFQEQTDPRASSFRRR